MSLKIKYILEGFWAINILYAANATQAETHKKHHWQKLRCTSREIVLPVSWGFS
jgi:hypothetical protein